MIIIEEGGVCLYVDDNINYSVRHDLNKMKHPDKTETLLLVSEHYKTNSDIHTICDPD